MVLSDNGMESYVFPVADLNGAAKPEQSKTVNITANGTQTVTPDSGKVLSSVVINTNVSAPAVQTQEKSVTITQNGASEVTPDTGKYLSKVSIATNVPSTPTPTQEKTQEITTNTTTTISPDEGYALSSVTVITNIPATPTQTKQVEITANTTTTITPDEGYNLSEVTVVTNVASKFPSLVDKSITEVSAEDLYGLTSIGLYAFYDCQNLTSITVPASVTSIGDHAFQCGSATNKVTITMLGSTPPTIAATTMQYDNIASIVVPYGAGATYQAATNWSNFSALITEAAAPPTTNQFATDTWEQIQQACLDGTYKTVYHVGDTKDITLTTNEVITVAILGFDHDDLATGTGKAAMTIGMVNLLAANYIMNATNTNVGGWDESLLRTSTMATLFSQLPSNLQSVIKPVNKKAAAGGMNTSITTSVDKLWILTFSEIFAATSIENSSQSNIADYADVYNAEGTQYKYYKNLIGDNNGGTEKNSLLIKKMSNGGGSVNAWWMRTVQFNKVYPYFREISEFGQASQTNADNFSQGLSFCFCI